MKKIYSLFLLVFLNSYSQTQIGSDINGDSVNDRCGASISLSSDGNVVAIGTGYGLGNGIISGYVKVYRNISGVWTQIGSNINGEASITNTDSYSVSLSADGNVVAMGLNSNDGNGEDSGVVRVYRNISGVWTQIGLDIYGEAAGDFSGSKVILSSDGSVLAIGAPHNDGNGSGAGHVRVYHNISGVWTQIGSDIDGEAPQEHYGGYGVSLSSDGNILAIGIVNNDGNEIYTGVVRVYRNISGVWTQIGSNINGVAVGDLCGYSTSLSTDGNTLAIGAPGNNDNGYASGHVRVYQNISGVWTQIGSDINGDTFDQSGVSISLSSDGNIIAIGTNNIQGYDFDSGIVRVYRNISGVWTQIGSNIYGEAIGDLSGYSISLSSDGNIIAIGAPHNDGNGADSGHVRVYDLSTILVNDTFVLDNFSIFPNPTSEIINIILENNLTLEKVNIYNSLGQLIKSEKSKSIEVKSLAIGNYFIEVITNKGKATKTIIIK